MNGRQAKKLRRVARREARAHLAQFHQQRTVIRKAPWYRVLMRLMAWRHKLTGWQPDPAWLKRIARRGCRIEVVS